MHNIFCFYKLLFKNCYTEITNALSSEINGAMAKVLDSDLEVSKFKLQEH